MTPSDGSPQHEEHPFAQHLAIVLEHAEPGYARARMLAQGFHLQTYGGVQGGLLVAMADLVFFEALVPMLQPDESAATVELKVNYLSAARLGDVLVAEGRITQRGRRIVVGDMEVREATSGRLLLKGLGTYVVGRRRDG